MNEQIERRTASNSVSISSVRWNKNSRFRLQTVVLRVRISSFYRKSILKVICNFAKRKKNSIWVVGHLQVEGVCLAVVFQSSRVINAKR